MSATRPIIGIPVGRSLSGNPDHAGYVRLRQTYIDAVVDAGGAPLLVPPVSQPAALGGALNAVDGLLFPGGVDVDAAHYGEPCHPTTVVDAVLDELELALAGRAMNVDKPILGICRGQQLLNVALGGSLVQDLPSSGIAHPQSGPERPRLAHAIRVASDSRLSEIFGAAEFEVNSHHHQAVNRLGRGLRAVAWSPDGVIEGVESSEHPWLLAVQFHPEDLVGSHEPSRRLFLAFVVACATRSRQPVGV